MLGVYPRAWRSRGSPASRALPWVVATAASISSISASSVARGFADSPGMPARRRRAARSVRRTARSGGVPADPWRRASWNSRSVSRPASAFARSRSKAVAQVRVRQPVLDPRERLRVGQLGDEALRAAREPGPVELADPVVHCEVAVELRVLQAEAGRGVVVHGGVPVRHTTGRPRASVHRRRPRRPPAGSSGSSGRPGAEIFLTASLSVSTWLRRGGSGLWRGGRAYGRERQRRINAPARRASLPPGRSALRSSAFVK